MAIVGYGKVSPKRIANQFLPEDEEKPEEPSAEKKKKKKGASSTVGISITGIEDVLVRFAHCCDPIPGDDIVGYISRGKGVTIHTQNCRNIQDLDPERVVDVAWNVKEKVTYPVHMRVVARDKKGILADISAVISSMDINISHAEINTMPDLEATCDFNIEVRDLKQFNELTAALKKLKGVLTVDRMCNL